MREAQPIRHAALDTLAKRVRVRWLLDRGRLGLLWGLGGAALLVLAGRLLGRPEWLAAALTWGGLALCGALAAALARWPDRWAVARAADGLGLEERVTSALHAARVEHATATLLQRDTEQALAALDPSGYALVPNPRRWHAVGLAAVALVAMAVAPLPLLGEGGLQAADAGAVAAAQQSVQALQADLARATTAPEPLARATAAELRALEERLARAASAAEAARALEEAQARMASLPGAEEYAWRRALDQLAATWAGHPALGGLAQALRSHDPQAIEQALAELAARTESMSPEQRQQLQLALQAGANAARDVPALAGALRDAGTGRAGERESGRAGDGGIESLRELLAQGVARSAGLRSTQQAVAGVGQARAALGRASGAAGGAGTPGRGGAGTGRVADGGSGGAGGSNSPVAGSGSGSGSGSGAGSGTGSGAGGSTGAGAGNGSGSGVGSGTGSGSGSGTGSGSAGSGGAGVGAGAGAGGGATPGQPGAGGAGLTDSGGNASPNNRGVTRYDPVYAPSLLGGEGGPQVHAPGDPAGAGGETVELPDSPKALGAVRPYDEVYGQYEAAARQSLARQPLPPTLQGLVQRYFSSISPEGGTRSDGR